MDEFLQSDDFRRYRKKQIEAVVNKMSEVIKGECTLETKGMLDMARILIRLPETFKLGKESKDLIKAQCDEDITEFQVKFVKSHIFEDEE